MEENAEEVIKNLKREEFLKKVSYVFITIILLILLVLIAKKLYGKYKKNKLEY